MKLEEYEALYADEFVVFDTETTNFKATLPYGKIIEIGAVKIRNNEIVEYFSEFINPEMKIPKKIIALTGITDEDVKDADTIYPVLRRFKEFCGNAVLVAHNAPFDTRFVEFFYSQISLPLETHKVVLDTVKLDKKLFPLAKSHKLCDVAERFGITQEAAHRAIDDATVTAKAFLKMKSTFQQKLAEQNLNFKYQSDVIVPDMTQMKYRRLSDFKKEGSKTRQSIDRLYVTIYYPPTNVYGSIYYDRTRKCWYNKDFPANYKLDFDEIERQVKIIRKGVL